jgi:hypothetical protein
MIRFDHHLTNFKTNTTLSFAYSTLACKVGSEVRLGAFTDLI